MNEVKRDNHYLPQFYLAGWADKNKRVQAYYVLVSNKNVPLWRRRSIKGVAYHQHLYTRMSGRGEVDDIERWLDKEFENPAQEVIHKVRQDKKLTPAEWRVLARYVASQDLRTPGSLVRQMRRWEDEIPDLLNSVLQGAVEDLKSQSEGRPVAAQDADSSGLAEELKEQFSEMVPVKVTKEIEPGADEGFLKLEITTGRALWLFQIRHLLSGAYRVLEQHRWSIVRPTEGTEWFTTDDPVVKVNYSAPDDYDFGGGWGSKGTDIILPLSPRHLLYTKVGHKHRLKEFEPQVAAEIRRCIAEHAHRYIFASKELDEVPELRPRVVDHNQYEQERLAWERWHSEQSEAEVEPEADRP